MMEMQVGKQAEFKFIVNEASLISEFGYRWATKSDAREQHVLRLDGDFEIHGEKRVGCVTLESAQDFPADVATKIEENVPISKQINIGTIALRKESPNACLKVPHEYLTHIWALSGPESQQLVLELRTVESVLEVRDVESISAEVTRISPPKKKRFWGDQI